jgi:hypothetical protein
MPASKQRGNESGLAGDRPAPAPGPGPTPASALDDDQICRWADRIAEGRDGMPDDLPPPDRDRLAAEVWRRLRDRLIRHVARAIAAQIRREAAAEAQGKGGPDAGTEV